MRRTSPQEAIESVLEEYLADNTDIPEYWTDLVEDYDDAERLKALLDPDLPKYETECERLFDRLQASLSDDGQYELLANLRTLWTGQKEAETHAMFQLGIAVGKHLLLH